MPAIFYYFYHFFYLIIELIYHLFYIININNKNNKAMIYKELSDYLIETRKKSLKEYNNIVTAMLKEAPNENARKKIWMIHLTCDPIGKLICKDTYNEVKDFLNEEVEF